jgi:site-specific recombinase XerD
MPPALAYARAAEPKLLASFDAYAARRGLHGPDQLRAARAFLRRWPKPQAWAVEPLSVRLALPTVTRSFLMFLLLGGHLHPGYDYLVRRKLTSFWRDVPHFSMAKHTTRFLDAAARLGFTERTRSATASQLIGRLLVQTGRGLDQLVEDDFEELLAACRERQDCDGIGPHYRRAVHTARQVLFHLEVFDTQPVNAISLLRQSFEQRMHAATPRLRPTFVAYLDRLTATHARNTVTGTASRLNDFAAHLAAIDQDLPSVAELDRRRHIETYLTATAEAVNSRTGAPLSASERRARVLAVHCLLNDIAEWGWPEAPARRLVFRSDIPKLSRPLPRYLTPDLNRQLAHALQACPDRLGADALLLQRATGLRIGELVDLELDCVHEVPGQGAWLKVPLGKLDTERMVPLDEETVALLDRIVAHRLPGRPIPHPRTSQPTEFLLTHHGRRVTVYYLRDLITRVTRDARATACHPAPAAAHLRHRSSQRRSLTAEPDGPARTRLGEHEPALRPAFRHHRESGVRARARRRQGPPRLAADRPARRTHHTANDQRRLERHASDQVTSRRRVLRPRTSPGAVRLRQHLRALPELPHRHRLPARARRATRRRPDPSP